MKRSYSLIILSVMILMTFSGCSDLLDLDAVEAEYNKTHSEEVVSEQEAESSVSETVVSSDGEEPDDPVSDETSELTVEEADYAAQYLQEYIETADKSGTQKIVDSEQTVSWSIRQYKIDDFNGDGSPELVIQYSCQSDDSMPEQGIAVEIVKLKDGELISYKRTSDFSDYVRIGEDGYVKHEIVDEVYVDDDGNIGILSTKITSADVTTLMYRDYVLVKDAVSLKNSLTISKEPYTGHDNLNNLAYSAFSIISNHPFVYTFYTRTAAAQINYISRDSGIAIQKEIMKCKPLDDFAVPDAYGHLLETRFDFDTANVQFCDIEEADSALEEIAE